MPLKSLGNAVSSHSKAPAAQRILYVFSALQLPLKKIDF